MTSEAAVTEVRDMFKYRRKEYENQRKNIVNKEGPFPDDFDPTAPNVWMDVWDYYDRKYIEPLTKEKIIERLSNLSNKLKIEPITALNIGVNVGALQDSSELKEKYTVAIPKMRPEVYLENAHKYVSFDLWEELWKENFPEQNLTVNENKFNQACKDYFDQNRASIEAIKEIGFVSAIIEENNGKIRLNEVQKDQNGTSPTYRNYQKPNLTDPEIDIDKNAIQQFSKLLNIEDAKNKKYVIIREELFHMFETWAEINNVSLDDLAEDESSYMRKNMFENIFLEVTDAVAGRDTVESKREEVFYSVELTDAAKMLNIFGSYKF